MRMNAVQKMELDIDQLENVSGGEDAKLCTATHSCYTAFMHDVEDDGKEPCWSDYTCFISDKKDVESKYNICWWDLKKIW